jgi:hypothetical protein
VTLRLLCAVLADRAVRIIQTERVYPPQPTGILPDERINGQVSFQQLFPVHLAVQVRKQP